MLKALIVNGAEDLAGGASWRCLNRRVLVDQSQWVCNRAAFSSGR